MGSSAKKKKEKRKDFQKPKLKVGKAKPKASNFTDTSFRSKAIVLQQQLAEDAPNPVDRFKHYLSLTTSRADNQRRDALSYLASQLSTNPPMNPVGTSNLLQKLLPIMSDSSGAVRGQLLRLLRHLPADEVRPHVERIMLYIRGAMTNISQEVKDDGLSYLEWLLDVAAEDVVSGAGCWVKPLKDFVSVLGWWTTGAPAPTVTAAKGGWTSAPRTTFGAKKYGQSFPRQMLVLAKFLEAGHRAGTPAAWRPGDWFEGIARAPRASDPFGYLGLFKPARDEDGEAYRTREDRRDVFDRRFRAAVDAGVDAAKREGGAAGRTAATLDQVLRDGMADYERGARLDDEDQGLWDGYVM
ncbi:Rix1 complex component [Durotheca rogersii]|uniref:Rix1 complex component n=1 Tax=Durotheca rogersii TaxID=419775 RepID=UPI00221E3938|nr:Rix1 complex component [Durotheca rogersii]KAI5867573.1 Rix1 complex component [Durotheca rogersii]